MRENYRPKGKIDVLFIGESPPPPKGNLIRYFYNEQENEPRRLYRKIAYALNLNDKLKPQGLQDFKNRKMWFTDIFDEPWKEVKTETIGAHFNRLFQEIKDAGPNKIIALLPKRKINEVFMYFFKRQIPNEVKLLHINPWRENKEQFKKKLLEFLNNC
ncbi:MAG: hypothetical protein QXF44_01940 [Candidatus Bathyarchaeia archaeon]